MWFPYSVTFMSPHPSCEGSVVRPTTNQRTVGTIPSSLGVFVPLVFKIRDFYYFGVLPSTNAESLPHLEGGEPPGLVSDAACRTFEMLRGSRTLITGRR